MRRIVFCSLLVWLAIALGAETTAKDTLPVGNHPPPIATPHFPSRLHAFVWRNWQLVEPRLLGQVAGGVTFRPRRVIRDLSIETETSGALKKQLAEAGGEKARPEKHVWWWD